MSDTSANQASATVETKGTVVVFVRDIDDGSGRSLTFGRPKGIPTTEFLTEGLAIDGGDVVISIGIDLEEDGHPLMAHKFGPYGTLSSALLDIEGWLVKFLGDHGYEVEFA